MNLRVHPRLTMLDREDCLRIHRASCEILRRTGIKIHSQAGLDLLRQAGAVVKDKLVKIPPPLVESALATAPGSFNLYKRGAAEITCPISN